MKKFDEGLASGVMLCVYHEYCYGDSAEELLISFISKEMGKEHCQNSEKNTGRQYVD